MKAMVTGGAGFIGSHLCEELKKYQYDLIILDNLFRGSFENISHIIGEKDSFYVFDLCLENQENLVQLLLKHKPDVIFHYAAINGTQYFYDIPFEVYDKNMQATQCLIYAVNRIICNQDSTWQPFIVYASSSEVYNEPMSIPTKESDITFLNINSMRDSYSASKLFGEFLIKFFCEKAKIPWLILRLFNVYGPKMIGTKYGQVIPEFIKRLKNGEYPLSIIGSGKQTRSFCYVSDHVNLTLQLIMKGVRNEIINVGNPDEITIVDLASLIMCKMGLEPCFTFLPERENDHKRRCPDIDKMKSYISYDLPFLSLEEGLDLLLKN